jgi:CHAD domain-containing protein
MAETPKQRMRSTIDRTSRFLDKLAEQPSAENVHRFRTHSRRVETILRELVPDPSRSQAKLLKQLVELRKKAGKIRDLNVQIAAMRNLKMAQSGGHKAQFLRSLSEELSEREARIAELLDKKTVRQIQKRLARASTELQLPAPTQLLEVAIAKFDEAKITDSFPSDETSHHYRIVGKRARYIAELAGDTPEATRFIEQLKHMQDLLGEWHDWLQLSMRSERSLGGSEKSPMSAALQNITRVKLRLALTAILETRAAFRQPTAVRKPSKRASKDAAAAVA